KRYAAAGWRGCPRVVLGTTDAKDAAAAASLAEAGKSFHALEDILQEALAGRAVPPREPPDAAEILYTSGATGRPKGVVLSHENLTSNLAAFNARLGLTSEDSLLLVAPLHYIHGRIQLLTHAMIGGTIYFSAGFQFPQVVLQELVLHGPT